MTHWTFNSLAIRGSEIHQIHCDEHGERVAIARASSSLTSGVVQVFSVRTRAIIGQWGAGLSSAHGVALCGDTLWFVAKRTQGNAAELCRADLRTPGGAVQTVLRIPQVSYDAGGIACDRTGEHLLLFNDTALLLAVTPDGGVREVQKFPAATAHRTVTGGFDLIRPVVHLCGVEPGAVRSWNLATLAYTAWARAAYQECRAISTSEDGRWVATTGTNGYGSMLWDRHTERSVAPGVSYDAFTAVQHDRLAAVLPDGESAILVRSGEITVWRLNTASGRLPRKCALRSKRRISGRVSSVSVAATAPVCAFATRGGAIVVASKCGKREKTITE